MTEEGASVIDPERVDFALDPLPGPALHSVLHAFRARGPVGATRFMGLPAFVICGHEALDRAFQDSTRFPGHLMYAAGFEPAIGQSFISEPDPARHRQFRKLATPAFRSRAIQNFAQSGLAELAHELIDEIDEGDGFDLIPTFTSRFPYWVISRLLGLPRDQESEFHQWALALLTFREDPSRAMEARKTFSSFLQPIIEARRRAPEEDVISELVGAEVEGRRLTDEEVLSHIRLLFPTGGETTYGSLSNLLHALLSHEGAWARMAEGPEVIEAAVREGLRWETPIAVLPRLSAADDGDFMDVRIPANSWVLFAVAGANRDPAVYDSPDCFDLDRVQPPNLVFGRGVKSCPGMHLAQKNMAVALEVLVDRFPALELTDAEASLPRRTVLRSPDALRVRRSG